MKDVRIEDGIIKFKLNKNESVWFDEIWLALAGYRDDGKLPKIESEIDGEKGKS